MSPIAALRPASHLSHALAGRVEVEELRPDCPRHHFLALSCYGVSWGQAFFLMVNRSTETKMRPRNSKPCLEGIMRQRASSLSSSPNDTDVDGWR